LEVVSWDRDRQRCSFDDCRPAAIAADARRGEEMKTSTAILLGVAAYGGV
jgi:hypothetical protein